VRGRGGDVAPFQRIKEKRQTSQSAPAITAHSADEITTANQIVRPMGWDSSSAWSWVQSISSETGKTAVRRSALALAKFTTFSGGTRKVAAMILRPTTTATMVGHNL
jgi:hypothetical protein